MKNYNHKQIKNIRVYFNMRLTERDEGELMKQFPVFDLCYEKKIHNKVRPADLYLIIPKGNKYFAWFFQYKNCYVCIILQLQNRREIENIKIYQCCFHSSLCVGKGTILYGTILKRNNQLFFLFEDIYYFKDMNIHSFSQRKKLYLMHTILTSHLKPITTSSKSIIFQLPIMDTNYETLRKKCENIIYGAFCIQHRSSNNTRCYLNQPIQQKYYAIFCIKTTLMPDIYSLYCYDGKKALVQHNYAHIGSYQDSVMMNELFREIKENTNLDTLEESDDEEEFQNIAPDKYIYLDRKYNMKCVYNYKFKRWIPRNIDTTSPISSLRDILDFEKK